jgi:Cys-tRNA(Pro)/Cys-tRNA(Cys) deacylase
MVKNNVVRLLENRKIPHTVFELPAEKLGARETAALLGVPPSQVFKTIVVQRASSRVVLVVVPGDREVDLKALAAFLGEKKVHLPSEREAEAITQLQAGGISPLALLNKGFLVIVDRRALDWESIHISGGQRGLNIRLAPQDLIALCQAKVADVSREEHSP